MVGKARLLLMTLALCGCAALAITLAYLAFTVFVQIIGYVPIFALGGVALSAGTLSVLLVVAAREIPRIGSVARAITIIGVAAFMGLFVGVYSSLFPFYPILPLAFAFAGAVIVVALPRGRVAGPGVAALAAIGASALLLTPSIWALNTLLSGYFTNLAVVRGLYSTSFICATFGVLYAIAMAAVFVGQLRQMPPVQVSPAAV